MPDQQNTFMKNRFLTSCAFMLSLATNAQVYHHPQAEFIYQFNGNTILNVYPIGRKLIYMEEVTPGKAELWSTDGTQANTLKITDTFASHDVQLGWFGFKGLANIGSKYYIAPLLRTGQANIYDKEPFITDGTIAGTYVLADMNANTGGPIKPSDPRSFTSFDNAVIFCATVGNYEHLYSHDGVAQPVKLMDDFFIHESIIYDQELYLVRSNNFNGKTGLYKMSNALST